MVGRLELEKPPADVMPTGSKPPPYPPAPLACKSILSRHFIAIVPFPPGSGPPTGGGPRTKDPSADPRRARRQNADGSDSWVTSDFDFADRGHQKRSEGPAECTSFLAFPRGDSYSRFGSSIAGRL
jgi:hypothetical protein